MSKLTFSSGSTVGSALSSLLLCDDIEPGSVPSYEMCKVIYLYHPVGAKMASSPVKMAQSIPREIVIPGGPEEDIKKVFIEQWNADKATDIILNFATQARVYGISSLAIVQEGVDSKTPLDVAALAESQMAFNVLDPLNTSGSLVLNQNPNAIDFQKHKDIAINGVVYHRSRTVTLMNEQPIYIAYTDSAFGFVGRSVYQRALFPLKSFVQTMIADDMVSRKVGLIVAALKIVGSVVDAVMSFAASFKRNILKQGATNNVITIGEGETITSLDLTNLSEPLKTARKDILENIAAAGDMPAKLLNNETFAEGFGEGTEDAKAVAGFVDGIREWLSPAYKFMDMVVQRRAWTKDFYKTIQAKYEEYKNVSYETAFYEWSNSFSASWPSLLREPESEKVNVAEVKFKSQIAALQVLLPILDPENKVTAIEWIADTFNSMKELFAIPLVLDFDLIIQYDKEQAKKQEEQMAGEGDDDTEEPKPAPPFSARDSALAAYMGRSNGGDPALTRRLVALEDWARKMHKV